MSSPLGSGSSGFGQADLEDVAGLHLLLGFFDGLAVDGDLALFDQALDAVARKFAGQLLPSGTRPCGRSRPHLP